MKLRNISKTFLFEDLKRATLFSSNMHYSLLPIQKLKTTNKEKMNISVTLHTTFIQLNETLKAIENYFFGFKLCKKQILLLLTVMLLILCAFGNYKRTAFIISLQEGN